MDKMAPLNYLSKPGKMVKPETVCEICKRHFLNSRALVQHNQLVHLFKYDRKK